MRITKCCLFLYSTQHHMCCHSLPNFSHFEQIVAQCAQMPLISCNNRGMLWSKDSKSKEGTHTLSITHLFSFQVRGLLSGGNRFTFYLYISRSVLSQSRKHMNNFQDFYRLRTIELQKEKEHQKLHLQAIISSTHHSSHNFFIFPNGL